MEIQCQYERWWIQARRTQPLRALCLKDWAALTCSRHNGRSREYRGRIIKVSGPVTNTICPWENMVADVVLSC
eukprot:6211847-Pleurochrysis_carterae.AAC.2